MTSVPPSTTPPTGVPLTPRQRWALARTTSVASAPAIIRAIELLFVIRESDRNAYREMAKMFKQVLGRHRHMPEVARVLEAAAELLRHPQAGLLEAIRRLDPIPLIAPQTAKQVGWYVERKPCGFVIAMTSAAATNSAGSNDFCDMLGALITAKAPERIVTGPPNRIIRVKDHADTVREAGKRAQTVLDALGYEPMDLATEDGRRDWDVVGWQCEGEYRGILARLHNGELDLINDGFWPKAASAAGYGYTEDPAAPAGIGFDPDAFPIVWRLIEESADASKSEEDIAEVLGSLGMTSPALERQYGAGATVADAQHKVAAMRSRWRWLTTYETGEYRYAREVKVNPKFLRSDFELTDILGGPLPDDNWRRPEEDRVPAYLIKTLRMGRIRRWKDETRGQIIEGFTPAEQAVLQRAITLRLTEEPGAPVPREGARPFVHQQYVDGSDLIDVTGEAAGKLTVRARPLSPAPAPPSRGRRAGRARAATAGDPRAGTESRVLARVSVTEFLKDLATRTVDRLERDGFTLADLFPDAALVAAEAREEALRFELDVRRRQAAGLREEAAGYEQLAARAFGKGDVSTGEGHEVKADQSREGAANLDDEVADIEAQLSGVRDTPRVDVGELAMVLSYMTEPRSVLPAPVVAAIHQLWTGLRWRPTEDRRHVRWTATAHVRTSVGMRELSVDGTVAMAAYTVAGSDGTIDLRSQLKEGIAHAFLVEGRDLSAVADAFGVDEATVERHSLEWLKPHIPSTGHRTAIVDGPGSLRRTLGLHVAAARRNGPAVYPADLAANAPKLVRSYTGTGTWTLAWAGDTHVLAEVALDYVAQATDPEQGVLVADLVKAMRLTSRELAWLLDVRPNGATQPYQNVLERVPWHDSQGIAHDTWKAQPPAELRRVRLRRCDSCGRRSLTQPLRVPEIDECVLCPTCQRQPGQPEQWGLEYFAAVRGPRGRVASGTGQRRTTVGQRLTLREWQDQRGASSASPTGGRRIDLARDTIVALYEDERLTIAEVARRLGVSVPVVTRHMAKFEIPARKAGARPGGAWTPTRGKAEVRRAYANHNLVDTATLLGLSRGELRRHLDHYGIAVRNPRETITKPAGRPFRPRADRAALEGWYVQDQLSTAEIGQLLNCSADTVTRHLHHFEIPVRPRSRQRITTLFTREQLIDAYITRNLGSVATGTELGVSPATVLVWLRRWDIPVRPTGKAITNEHKEAS